MSFDHFPHVDSHITATDGAHVGQQIGVQHGDNYSDTAFHYSYVYNVNQEDPPERRHEVALNHLNGGTPRFAEKLFGELLWNGDGTTERAYYYVLSVLSDRSLHEIRGELLTGVVNARKICDSLARDMWREALDVVWRLLRHMRLEAGGEAGEEHLRAALTAFGALPAERQDEIALHMDMVIGGVMQERLEAGYARRVVSERMRPGRAARAWKFFQPEPAKPRLYTHTASKADRADWLRAVVGGAGVLLGVLSLPSGAFGVGALLGAALVALGGYLLLGRGIALEAAGLRVAVKQREVVPPEEPEQPQSPGHWVSTEFVHEIHRLVEARFRDARPHVAGDWPAYTEGIRAHLKQRFVDLYGNAQVTAAAVNWLIRWHAKRVAAGWGEQGLFRYQAALAASGGTAALFRVGAGIAVAGLLVLMGSGQGVAALFIAAGGFFGAKAITRIGALRSVDGFLRADAEQLYAEEMRAYEEWVAKLADRPTDAEMARWLAMDKIHLKTDAIRRAGLSNHDLVAHVVMTEGAKGAMRARVLHGPPRYSAYVVQIFLLTRSGVREARVELDFLTGEARNERRNLFRYDALASASVTESGVRGTRGDREVERLRSRTFRLTLVNGQHITMVAENFRSAGDATLEDESELFLVALQTSGIEGALPILEAVASEGRDWIVREQERRERWSRAWYE
ncbi:hypothetical protein [Saccharothrix coeruleofusca]|nr:hypothetical protein [Saccharothrix coeruleofusca]MBP2338887.1 hypothetical protein [Saccharothrix coeruleofusca]